MKTVSNETQAAGGWLKDLLLQVIDGAVADVKALSTQPEASLHRLRVRMKKVGALLRLAKPAVSKEVRHSLRGQVRAIKDSCAGARDAEVLSGLAEALGEKRGLHLNLRQEPKKKMLAPSAAKLRGLLLHLRRQLAAETFVGLSWDDVRDDYAVSYKKGRRCMHEAKKAERAEDYHEWRKRVKTLYYQMVALHGSVPHLRKRMRRMHKLGHLLGREHDLAVLEQQTVAGPQGQSWQELIEKKRQRIRSRVLDLGKKVYGTSARRFAKLRQVAAGTADG